MRTSILGKLLLLASTFFCRFHTQRLFDSQACRANQKTLNTLSGNNGAIPSTDKVEWLPVNATCQWNITAPVGKILRINITLMFAARPCGEEYLRIQDGSSKARATLTEFTCNSSIVNNGFYLYSSGRSLHLEVKTGIVDNSTAMHLTFQALEKQECSINSSLDAPEWPTENNFSSPYYPFGFPMNTTCGWYIMAAENHTVRLEISSQLSSSPSSNDSVEFFDVDGSDLSLIAPSRQIYSKLRFVYVVFKSDGKAGGFSEQGLFVKYSAVREAHSCSGYNSLEENLNIVLRDPSGIISTPRSTSGQCHWKIIAAKGRVMRVEVLSFQLNRDGYVQFADRINGMNPVIITRSGRLPSFNFYSWGNELSIYAFGYRGFSSFIANYTTVPAALSGTCIPKERNGTINMSGEGRSFSTPGYPRNPGIGTCSWNITVPVGKLIKVTFWELKFCRGNSVSVWDFTNSTYTSLGQFCDHHTHFNEFYSIRNNLLVWYESYSSAYSGGFVASYEAVKAVPARYSCTKRSDKMINVYYFMNGEFASYDYPLSYPNNVECSWKIERSVEYVIRIKFHSFDLGPKQDTIPGLHDCFLGDRVTIMEGVSKQWFWHIGRFCGSSLPPVIQSNYSNVYVYFSTDDSGRYPGFHASYEVVTNPAMGPCNDTTQNNIIPLSGETGRLFSPLYPRNSPRRITCTWVVTAPEGHFVKLRIKDLQLDGGCRTNLHVRDGNESWSNLLKTMCNVEFFYGSISSSGRYLWVQFDSNQYFGRYTSKFDAVFEVEKQVPARVTEAVPAVPSVPSVPRIVGICIGALSAFCLATFIAYKCWKKKHNQARPHATVHSLTNAVESDYNHVRKQDTSL